MNKNALVILMMFVLCSCASQDASQRGVASEAVDGQEPEVVGAVAESVNADGFPFVMPSAEDAAAKGCSVPTHLFSAGEVARQKAKMPQILKASSACLDRYWNEHTSFHKKNGFSKFYGNRNPKYKTPELRRQALKELGKDPKREKELVNISCIDLALRCLGEGYSAAGEGATFKKAQRFAGGYGTKLQNALQALGWKGYYWNPDPSKNAEWDAADRARRARNEGHVAAPGQHQAHFNIAKARGCYQSIKVDDMTRMVGFGKSTPSKLKNAPFYIGTAHAGYHVFPGKNGEVIEAHSMRRLSSIENLEKGDFNPEGGGAPFSTNTEVYRSGIMLLPPGY